MSAQRVNKELLDKIRQLLREIRKDKNLTQFQFISDTQIHIGRIEAGIQNITISTLYILCDYYGISLIEFFQRLDGK